MSEQTPGAKKRRRASGVVNLVLVATVLGAMGFGIWSAATFKDPQATAAEAYLEAFRSSDLDAAYALLGADQQAATPRAEFPDHRYSQRLIGHASHEIVATVGYDTHGCAKAKVETAEGETVLVVWVREGKIVDSYMPNAEASVYRVKPGPFGCHFRSLH